ncbi:MAG: hypothetical protein H0X34_07155 [Chthoniobacterales bacterium]|nr:hypothetical protein [Chthoniobacterales bacterium]
MTWNEMDGEMDDRNGLAVLEQTTPRYNVTRTENGVKDLSAGTDGSVFGSELFEITGTFNANMGWGDFVKIKSIGEARESQALLGAATSLADKIDAYILAKATLASCDWTGTPNNAIAQWSDAAAAHTRLTENGVDDSELSFIMSAFDRQQLGDQLVKLPNETGAGTYRKGFSGEIDDIRTMFTNQLPNLLTGTRAQTGAGLVNGANQNVDYAAVAKAGTSNGQSMTQLIALDGFAAGATVKAGEVFTWPGVFAFDNRKQAPVSPARLQQFTVVTDAVADGAGVIAAMRIFPAMVVPGSGAGDNININTAHATVTAAPADNSVLTFIGAANTNLSPRLLIQKQAIVVNTVPLILPASDTSMRRKLKKIPLTVRMWQHSDFYTGAHGVRFDVALNANIRERRRMSRMNGA